MGGAALGWPWGEDSRQQDEDQQMLRELRGNSSCSGGVTPQRFPLPCSGLRPFPEAWL